MYVFVYNVLTCLVQEGFEECSSDVSHIASELWSFICIQNFTIIIIMIIMILMIIYDVYLEDLVCILAVSLSLSHGLNAQMMMMYGLIIMTTMMVILTRI